MLWSCGWLFLLLLLPGSASSLVLGLGRCSPGWPPPLPNVAEAALSGVDCPASSCRLGGVRRRDNRRVLVLVLVCLGWSSGALRALPPSYSLFSRSVDPLARQVWLLFPITLQVTVVARGDQRLTPCFHADATNLEQLSGCPLQDLPRSPSGLLAPHLLEESPSYSKAGVLLALSAAIVE